MTRIHPFTRLLWPLCLAMLLFPLGIPPQARPVAAASAPVAPAHSLAAVSEVEPNDTTALAQRVSPLVPVGDWAEQVSGKISTSSDIDYYKISLLQPASRVKITLDTLPGDYDLILASDSDVGMQQGESGIEDITNIGGSIASIGGSIASIGGSIASIGGSIASIGGSIASISTNSGTTAEVIDTYLWQPGTYYVAVASASGAYSDTSSYNLNIQVSGSGMSRPSQAAPEVQMQVAPPTYATLDKITTLYVTFDDRMSVIYPQNAINIRTIDSQVSKLASVPPSFPVVAGRPDLSGPPEYGYVLDLSHLVPTDKIIGPTITSIYSDWDANRGNPVYANKIARLIDNVIKAATNPARNGISCPPNPRVTCPTPTMYYDGGAPVPNGAAPFPNVKHIVLVGGDNVLPFFRVPDLTTIANESDYAAYLKSLDSTGIIDPGSPQGAALRDRMLLTDNPYGTDKPLRFQGFPLYLPNRAIGRLVESPEDIQRYLAWQAGTYQNTYTINARGDIEVGAPALVTGYDFLSDEATVISNTLYAGMGISPTTKPAVVTGPISDAWTRSDLEKSWFGNDLTTAVYTQPVTGIFSNTVLNVPYQTNTNKIFSLNAHFDHWQILPATGASSIGGTFPAQRIRTPSYTPDIYYPGGYFGGTLGYSVGCHSGYNVIDSQVLTPTNRLNSVLYQSDFPQAFNKQAGNWIGNTGYGYGTADGIDYSERLAVLLTQEIIRDERVTIGGTPTYAGASIGTALARAKQRYVRNTAVLSAYDAKALTVMTLYGLPFIHIQVSNPLAPPPEEPQVGAVPIPVPMQSNAPILPNSDGRLERTITATINIQSSNYVTVPRTLSKVLRLTDQNFTLEDSFVDVVGSTFPKPHLRIFENSQAGLPTLPTFAYDISALNSSGSSRLQVRDVVFVGGEYAPTTSLKPQITQIVTQTDNPITASKDEPTFTAGAGIWYPDKFFGFSSVGSGMDQHDQLTATAAQFKADATGVTGRLRGYAKMIFKVYYIDPTAASLIALNDTTAPSIQSVQISQVTTANALSPAAAGVTIVATVDNGTDGTELDGVSGVYVLNGTTWTPVTFAKVSVNGAIERWQASIPLLSGQVRVVVSATDKAGNVGYYTAKGALSITGSQVFLPLVLR